MNIPLSPCVPENLVSRDGFSRPVPRQPVHSPYSGLIWCLLTEFLPSSAAASIYLYKNRHTPSGQSRVYRVTQLRTDDVHCRESAGTGPVNFKAVPNECCLEQPIMRTEDRLFDRGWVRSAMATRKCGNIYFPKYFMGVRPFFTRIFFQELFGLEGSKNLLENFVRCTI